MKKNATITFTLHSPTELKVQCTNENLTEKDFIYFLALLKKLIKEGVFEIHGGCEYIEENLNL